ncbi:unnamed protein product [Arctia plantaginis]|uniref:Uncharacterized protein n=1 Tax=Arctia plantaginis TaxID=874455 RepID=A0A8S0Z4B4_ARCPL|nr:unnamed protein product [Arctia plantaginis]
MSVIGTVYEDVTSDVVGKIGSWQWLITFVSAALMVSTMFNQYEDMFLLHASNINCISPSEFEAVNSSLCVHNITIGGNASEVTKCNKWNLKLLWVIWLRKTWLVFCAGELKLLSTAIISRFGLVFGCIIFGLLADKYV